MKNNWCIQGCTELAEYFKSIGETYWNGNCPNLEYTINKDGKWDTVSSKEYTIITLQQYLDMNKKIIDYKVKPEFIDSAALIVNAKRYEFTPEFNGNSVIYTTLKALNLIEIWCTEVYESKPEFKIGEIVVVTERHRNNPSKAGDIVEIRKIDDHTIPYYVYNKREDDCDWCVNVRKPTEAEVEEYNSKSKVFTINCDEPFEVEVSKQGIFYKNEDVWICPIDIGELLSISDDYSVQYDKVKINGASKKWDISINAVNIGCKKNCNLVDITLAYNYYKSLQ